VGEQDFEREVLQRLTRIETHQESIAKDCVPCQTKIDALEIATAENKSSLKSAHHRIDTMQVDRSELKTDLKDTIKEQIAGIYRTAIIAGGLTSFFVGIIIGLITFVVVRLF
jgi:tetrahydromethanopterin S-methyltransferase subunit B